MQRNPQAPNPYDPSHPPDRVVQLVQDSRYSPVEQAALTMLETDKTGLRRPALLYRSFSRMLFDPAGAALGQHPDIAEFDAGIVPEYWIICWCNMGSVFIAGGNLQITQDGGQTESYNTVEVNNIHRTVIEGRSSVVRLQTLAVIDNSGTSNGITTIQTWAYAIAGYDPGSIGLVR